MDRFVDATGRRGPSGWELGALAEDAADHPVGGCRRPFRASVLLAGGALAGFAPEANVINFAPRSRVPTLMINGTDDFLTPFELAQQPLFRLLAAPASQKRHARLEGGHIPHDRLALIEEVVGWFDRHLGTGGTVRRAERSAGPAGAGE